MRNIQAVVEQKRTHKPDRRGEGQTYKTIQPYRKQNKVTVPFPHNETSFFISSDQRVDGYTILHNIKIYLQHVAQAKRNRTAPRYFLV